jgi:hypothetical protein
MLKDITPGDVVMVTRIDRLARSTFDLFATVKRIVDAGGQFRSLAEPWADTATSTGRLMIAILGGLADHAGSRHIGVLFRRRHQTRRGRRSGPEVGVVGEGNQGIVGDEDGDAVELDHCSANPNANPRIGGLIRTSDECYSPGRETAVERAGGSSLHGGETIRPHRAANSKDDFIDFNEDTLDGRKLLEFTVPIPSLVVSSSTRDYRGMHLDGHKRLRRETT